MSQEKQKVKVSLELLQQVLNYLAARPYAEVAKLVSNISLEVSENQQEKAE
jgi:hypothetical protein